MVTKLQDTKAVKGSSDEHGGNRGGNQEKRTSRKRAARLAARIQTAARTERCLPRRRTVMAAIPDHR